MKSVFHSKRIGKHKYLYRGFKIIFDQDKCAVWEVEDANGMIFHSNFSFGECKTMIDKEISKSLDDLKNFTVKRAVVDISSLSEGEVFALISKYYKVKRPLYRRRLVNFPTHLIFYDHSLYLTDKNDSLLFNDKNILNCGDNCNGFLEIANLRDDTDKNQWFTDGKLFEKTNSDMPSKYMQMNGYKATVKEIMDHFK